MKILFCTNAFEKVTNGPAKFAHLLLEEGATVGLGIRILTEDITSGNQSVYKLDLSIPRSFKLFGLFIRMWKYHIAAMKIRKEYEFDLLVYNNAIIGLLSFLFFKKTIGMVNDYSNATNSLIDVFKRKARLNKRILFYYIECLTCHVSKCIIVNSLYLKEKLQIKYHCRESLFKILHKGIENKLVVLNRNDILQQKIGGSVLFVKTDFVLGGLYTLIEALKKIDRKITLFIVGPPLVYHGMLIKLLYNTQVSFELFDYLPQEKIYEKMQQSEIFCVPSKREAFGVANLEALAMGCKVVSTNVGGIPEAMGNGSFAWLVEPDDPVVLGAALKLAMDTPIKSDMRNIAEHLKQFSSFEVISRFKEILIACLYQIKN